MDDFHAWDALPLRLLLLALGAVALLGAVVLMVVGHPIRPAKVVAASVPPGVTAPSAHRTPAAPLLHAPWATARMRQLDAAAVADILADVGHRFPAWAVADGVTTWALVHAPRPALITPRLRALPANGSVTGLAAAVAAAEPTLTHAARVPGPALLTRAGQVAAAWALADAGNQLAAPFARLDSVATYGGMLDADSFVGTMVNGLTQPGLGSLANGSYTYRAWVTWAPTPASFMVGTGDTTLRFPASQTVGLVVRAQLTLHAVLANRTHGQTQVVGVQEPMVLVLASVADAAGTHWLVLIASAPGWQPTGAVYWPT